jgi:hypothetical protein
MSPEALSKCRGSARRACARGVEPRDADRAAASPKKRDRRAVGALALVFGAILSLGIAIVSVARVPYTADMAKSAEANLPIERTLVVPSNK